MKRIPFSCACIFSVIECPCRAHRM